jgi:hypothetical protein
MNENDFLAYLTKIENKIKNSILFELPQIKARIALEILKNKYISEVKLGLQEQNRNEKIAVITSSPKLHALFFDRIDCQALIGIQASSIPWEYVNRFITYESSLYSLLVFLSKVMMEDPVFEELRSQKMFNELVAFFLVESNKFSLFGSENCPYAVDKTNMVRRQSEGLKALYNVSATPVYSSTEEFIKEFEEGSHSVTQRVIENLSIVDDDELEWAQVKQFREDREARHKYALFLEFLKSKWESDKIDYYSYQIESKYQGYNNSLKKHGIKTRVGIFKDIFSAKFLLPTSLASITSSLTYPELTSVIAGLFAFGTLSVSLAEYKLNLRFDPPDESIAWIYELKKRVNT